MPDQNQVQNPSVDLSSYLERIGLASPVERSLPLLEALQLRHLDRIPFENIDVWLGRGVRLDLETLQDKLVRRRRGGYCFEQNTLAAAVLRALGFEVATLEARVRPPGATTTLPRTHMVLRVDLDGKGYLFDVGFGGDGPLVPVPLDGSESEQADAGYRVVAESAEVGVLCRRGSDGWTDLYAFSRNPALRVDFEVANYFTATHPDSIFRRTLTVQRSTPTERRILRDGVYVVRRDTKETRRDVAAEEVGELLRGAFGLELTPEEIEAVQELTPPASASS